ncbi:Gfo/Idh/MocA family oxidoreductase [Caballeronia sp. AZ7_KS35]|uniref:Gfo/Idh/MocA family oxidoreductase n=1 Tax=Caballeronia sp. AZ7_KS35 TaxID=2921762 RepID=UPI002027A01E|nr:Gfo/Idh/MocA family oxidoreductase [Caballeronia sp. AZ7_KS35]
MATVHPDRCRPSGGPRPTSTAKRIANAANVSQLRATDWIGKSAITTEALPRILILGTGHGLSARRQKAVNQFAREIDHMSICVKDDIVPRTPGDEGLQEQRIIDGIYESAHTGRAVKFVQPLRRRAARSRRRKRLDWLGAGSL